MRIYERKDRPKPDPVAVAYHKRVNREARDLARLSGRYVTVRFGQDVPSGTREGWIGITYDPNGEYLLSGVCAPATTAAILKIVSLANAALDAGLLVEESLDHGHVPDATNPSNP